MSEFLSLRQSEPVDLDAEFCGSTINIDGKTVYYLTIPSRGCMIGTCAFCAYKRTGITGLTFNEQWREAVARHVGHVTATGATALFVTNDGNILTPAEMDPATILEYVPKMVAQSPTCNALEIEVSAKDLLLASVREKLQTIRGNLSGKELCVRLAVEYADNELLARNLKEVTMKDVDSAISALSSAEIPWIGYAMFGGVEMTSEEARNAAIQTGKFIIDRGAQRLALNGLFVTEDMKTEERLTGRRLYVPSMEDLLVVLKALSDQNQQIPTKVGLDEVEGEDRRLHVVEYPYGIPVADPKERRRLMGILSDFDRSQAFETFQVEVMRNWAKFESFRRLNPER